MVKEINMQHSIVQRISEAEARLAGLRAKRGSALLDGENIDAAEYANAEAELAALRDAEGEQVRRERQAAGQARGSRRDEQRARLRDLERQRVEALQDAEEAARTLAETLGHLLSVNEEMAGSAHEISGTVPSPLSGVAFARRLSDRLSAVMSTVAGHKHRMGNLVWPTSMCKPDQSWAAEESRLVEPHLKPILTEN